MYNEVQSTEITGDIRVSDILSIQTRNSVYQFFVIDPVRVFGVVTGGIVGERAVKGFLCQPVSLKLGCKARLCVESKCGLRFITTSAITAVRHIRNE